MPAWKYPGRVYCAVLNVEAVATSTYYILVDRSDTTYYDHPSGVSSFNVLALDVESEKATDGAYDVFVGVVLENDATNGTATWFHVFHLEASGNSTDSTDRFSRHVPFTCEGLNERGLDTTIVSNATPYITGPASGDLTALQNDAANLASAGDATANKSAGAGDIIVYVEEVSGAGTIDLALTCLYSCN